VTSNISALFGKALGELEQCLQAIDPVSIETMCDVIAGADRICLYGCGREGLVMRALCMRLFHLGMEVTMVGDMTTPPVGPGDLLMVSAGPGTLSTVLALMDQAKGAGAKIACFTAEIRGKVPNGSDVVLVIPAQTMARDRTEPSSTLPMGSLYEGAMFLLFEIMVLKLQDILGETTEGMRSRHTNLE